MLVSGPGYGKRSSLPTVGPSGVSGIGLQRGQTSLDRHAGKGCHAELSLNICPCPKVMFQLMTVSPKIVSPQNSSPLCLSSDNAGIQFDGVSFQYQSGQPILDNLSFSVGPGQSIAIVGGLSLSSVRTENISTLFRVWIWEVNNYQTSLQVL